MKKMKVRRLKDQPETFGDSLQTQLELGVWSVRE
jgi:hypothetical protein